MISPVISPTWAHLEDFDSAPQGLRCANDLPDLMWRSCSVAESIQAFRRFMAPGTQLQTVRDMLWRNDSKKMDDKHVVTRVWNYRRSLIVASRCERGQSLCSQNFANQIFLMLDDAWAWAKVFWLGCWKYFQMSITHVDALFESFYTSLYWSSQLTFRYFKV